MTFFYLIISLLIGLFGDMLVSGSRIIAAVPAFTLIIIFYWFQRLPLAERFWLAIGTGVIIDSLFLHPFGSAVILLALLACCMEWLPRFFTKSESVFAQALVIFLLLCAFWFLLGPTAQAVEWIAMYRG